MGSHGGVAPGAAPHTKGDEMCSKYNYGTLPLSSPRLNFSPQQSLLPSASTPILRCVLYCRPCLHVSIRLLHEGDGSKTHRGGLPANGGGEWLGPGDP